MGKDKIKLYVMGGNTLDSTRADYDRDRYTNTRGYNRWEITARKGDIYGEKTDITVVIFIDENGELKARISRKKNVRDNITGAISEITEKEYVL